MSAGRGFLQHMTGSSRAEDEQDDAASSHLLAELQRGEEADEHEQQDGGARRQAPQGPDGVSDSRAQEDDDPPQSIMYEQDEPPDKDAESSHTPQPFPGSAVADPFAGDTERGRQVGPGTSATISTLRSNSASPPPDLLESASSPEMQRKGAIPPRRPAGYDVGPPASTTSSTSAAYQSFPPSGSRSTHDARALSAAEKGKGRAGPPPRSSRSSRRAHRNSQRDMINGDSLSDTSSSASADSRADLAPGGTGDGAGPSRSTSRASTRNGTRSRKSAWAGLDDRQKALWSWVNVVDLDGYLQEVYEYYTGKGFYCIALRRLFNLLTSAFVVIFSTFLLSCIDVRKFPKDGHGQLKDVVVAQCISRWSVPHVLLTWVFIAFFGWKLVSFVLSVPKLLEIKRFYEHLLDVPEADIQTISWPEVVRRIGSIRNQNPTTSLGTPAAGDAASQPEVDANVPKLDAHDVANRIMRQENYLIALFNKDILDLRVRIPLPQALDAVVPQRFLVSDPKGRSTRQYLTFGANTLTKALEWNLRYCLLEFLFDRRGLVRKEFVRERKRKDLVEQLQRRFIFIGVMNAIFAPFIVLYLMMYSFFRYFEEYHKNPSSIGSRQYTPYGRWKFRGFNELPHLFERRLDQSYPAAKRYIDQFPKEISALTMRFVAFIAGAFAAVLLLITVIDPVFLHFEITQNRTVLFYLGVFTSILAVTRGVVTQDATVFEPETLLKEVVSHTHYMPGEWEGKLHSRRVHTSFGQIFQMKVAVFLREIASVVLTPLILWFSLPPCAEDIIDFFREFTVHVEGVGYVCSFAVFDFKRHGNVKFGAPKGPAPASERMQSKEGKMEKSFLHFTATHPEWQPSDPSASIFLSRMTEQFSPRQGRSGRRANGHLLSPQEGPSPFSPPVTARDPSYLRDRSEIYERALQKSIMMRSTTQRLPERKGPQQAQPRSKRLESMQEQNEVNEAGWENAEVVRPGQGGLMLEQEDSGDGPYGPRKTALEEAGVMGLVKQVMR